VKNLLVLRHAKSSWDDPAWSDFERPLNDRGLRTAAFMGGLIRERGFVPDFVVSSPATRARQTAEIVCENAGLGISVNFDERIYEATHLTLFNLIREFADRYSRILIVGHNPGLESIVGILTGGYEQMPTAALAVIEINSPSWSEIEPSVNNLAEFFRPKALMRF
jgi:phosphohistidine phosphatase